MVYKVIRIKLNIPDFEYFSYSKTTTNCCRPEEKDEETSQAHHSLQRRVRLHIFLKCYTIIKIRVVVG